MSTDPLSHMAPMMSVIAHSLTIQSFVVLIVIASCTRFISGRNYKSDVSSSANPRQIAILPYWVPYFGHVFSLMSDPGQFLRKCSRHSPKGIFSLNLFGLQFCVITKPSLINAVFKESNAAINFGNVRWSILVNVFGANQYLKEDYMRVRNDAQACVMNGFLLDPGVSESTRKIVRGICEHTPNLVSFSESLVDQSQWERAADAELHVAKQPSKAEASVMEVDLFALIRNFVGSVALPSIVGTEFLEVYPKVLDDLCDLDDGFKYLAFGLPRWLPIPPLTKAHIARRNLLEGLNSFQKAIERVAAGEEPHQPWVEVRDIGPVMQERSSTWRAHGTASDVKAPFDLSLLWAMSTKSCSLVFWMITHICEASDLLARIRKEIGPHAKATQPQQLLGIPEPARLEINVDGLVQSCPLLKACFYECVRLYSATTSVRSVTKAFEISDTLGDTTIDLKSHSYVLEAGKIVAASLGVHRHESRYYESPNIFNPGRFLKPGGVADEKQIVVEGTLEPWGVGAFRCPGRVYAEKHNLAFVAGILALWDFEPANCRSWLVPEQKERSIVSVPCADVRVRIKTRPLR